MCLQMRLLSLGKSKDFFIYDETKGIYIPNAELYLERFLQRRYPKINTKEINEEINRLKRMNIRIEIPKERQECVCIQNGAFNFDTYQLEPHSPDNYFFKKIPVFYSHEIDYKFFNDFVCELVSPEQARLLQEFIGYCLLPDTRYQKALVLQGFGANGKSTFLKIISNFFGEKNVSGISLHQLEGNKFMLSNLYDKYINVFSDLPALALAETSVSKSIITGDSLEVEKKFKQAFTMQPTTKLLFSCNEFPKIRNPNVAFFRRWIIIEFKNVFVKNPKIDIEKQYFDAYAKSAIFNWALDGLKSLRQRGKFDIDENEMRDIWTLTLSDWYKNDKRSAK